MNSLRHKILRFHARIARLISATLFAALTLIPHAHNARPVTVPDLNTGTFQSVDMDPYFDQADLSGNQAQWEYLVKTGAQDLSAQWEAAADLEIDAQVAAVNMSDAFNSVPEYQAYLRRELEIQKGEDFATWELAADVAIQDRRSAFLDELSRRKQEATSADTRAFEEGSTLVVTSNGDPVDLEKRVQRLQAGWSSLFADDVEKGLAEFGSGIAVLEQDYIQLQRTLQQQDAEYQAGMLEIKGYEKQVRTAVANSVAQLEASLALDGFFGEQVCDSSGNNCAIQLNAAGQDLQTLVNGLKNGLINEAPLSSLAGQMVTYLQSQKSQAETTATNWTNQTRQTINLRTTFPDIVGQGPASINIPLIGAIAQYVNSHGATDTSLKAILSQGLTSGLSVESISNPDVCGYGNHNPYPLTVGFVNENECFSTPGVGTGAFTYGATGIGGWAGAPIIVHGIFNEDWLRFSGSYVIYDANADANATTWNDYTSDLGGFLNTWNDLLPALNNWEAQSSAYAADYAAWQTGAATTLQQATDAFETGVNDLVSEQNKWLSQMEETYRNGENEWLVIGKELEKKKTAYLRELENQGLNQADLERELERRSLKALNNMKMPSRPDARTAALQTTVRAHNKFGDIKNTTLKVAERADSSRLDEILSQFDKSVSGALNTAVIETLNQTAIDSRQSLANQITGTMKSMDGSVTQALGYGEALTEARALAGISDEMFADGFDGLSEEQQELLDSKLKGIFAREEFAHDEGFSATQDEKGNTVVKRMVPTGRSILKPGVDGTKPEHYMPEMREETFTVTAPAAMKLVKTEGLFEAWDLPELVTNFSKANQSYYKEQGDELEKILNNTLEARGNTLNARVASYQNDTSKQIETNQIVKSILESMITGGLDFKAALESYLEGQVRGQIAGAVSEMTGLPAEFISGLMGGQKPHEAVISMAENAAWDRFEQETGIEGISNLVRTHLNNRDAKKREKIAGKIQVEDFITGGATYYWRNQEYNGAMKTFSQITASNPMQNAYLTAKSEKGFDAFSSMVNGTLNGSVSQITSVLETAKSVIKGKGVGRSHIIGMTNVDPKLLEKLGELGTVPDFIKPRNDLDDDVGARLGLNHLDRLRKEVAEAAAEFGRGLLSGEYFADVIGGDIGDSIRRRTNANFAVADNLTKTILSPWDVVFRPLYRGLGMERTYDNMFAGYTNLTRDTQRSMRDALATNPALMDATAFVASGVYGCYQCYYNYAYDKGWHHGGNQGAVAEVANVALHALKIFAIDAGVNYTYENGWDLRLGAADPFGSASGGLTYSDQDGVGVYANVGPGKKEAGANVGFELSERGGLSLDGGYKWAGGYNLGLSYNPANGFGMTGGWSGNGAGLSGLTRTDRVGLNFGLSQRGGWNAGASLDFGKFKNMGIGLNYRNGPGDNDGFGLSGRHDGAQLVNYNMSTGKFTPISADSLIKIVMEKRVAEERAKALLKGHLDKANEQLADGLIQNVLEAEGDQALLAVVDDGKLTEDEWNVLSDAQKKKLYTLLQGEEATRNNQGDSQGEGILEDLWNSMVNGRHGITGGAGDQWGYVDSRGNYHRRTCFVAGTLVSAAEGFRPIEKIKVGDMVLSWNEKSGKLEYNKVTHTFIRTTRLIFQITYEDGTFIETTWNHPFYIKGRGWVRAKDLGDGDLSLTSSSIRGNSKELRITSVITDERADTVYNFTVERDHTYFVTGMGVLVHNQSDLPVKYTDVMGRFAKGVTSKQAWIDVYRKWEKEKPAEALILCSVPVAGLACTTVETLDHLQKGEYDKIAGNIAINLGSQVLVFAGGSAFIWVKGAGGQLIKKALTKLEVEEIVDAAAKGRKANVALGDGNRAVTGAEARGILGYRTPAQREILNVHKGKFKTLNESVNIDGKPLTNPRAVHGSDGSYYVVDGETKQFYRLNKEGKWEKACFVAGTKIHTRLGLRNIEEIQTGDLVYSRLKPGGKPVLRRVLKTFVRKVGLTLALTFMPVSPGVEAGLQAKAPQETRLVTTPEHPFRVLGKGWVEAGFLKTGDRVILKSGRNVRLIKIAYNKNRATVYNFKVAEGHSYFVGARGLWVHNSDYDRKQAVNNIQNSGVLNDLAQERINRFRKKAGLPEYDRVKGKETGTVARVEVNGREYFGVNSSFTPDSKELRIETFKKLQQNGQLLDKEGWNRVFALGHAEAHALMRAYNKAGKLPEEVTIHVDRKTCHFCSGKNGLKQLMELFDIKKLNVIMRSGKTLTFPQ